NASLAARFRYASPPGQAGIRSAYQLTMKPDQSSQAAQQNDVCISTSPVEQRTCRFPGYSGHQAEVLDDYHSAISLSHPFMAMILRLLAGASRRQ
ncbi:hypothetical protein, partial [Gluconacetobacter takamatsuzukensis]|uniref:hypothetical protein n=1 Tax=Gluconacetobacter takamatsuzukensis TaxID=1286190 RepID=UPI001C7F695A